MNIVRLLLLFFSTYFFSTELSAQEEGLASYYHTRFHGRKTASGLIHQKHDLVAAHRTLPFGTYVRVTNLKNNKKVIVTITDRGPRRKSRIIDVSRSAADSLGFIKSGITRVRIEVVPGPIDLRFLDFMNSTLKYFPITNIKDKEPLIFRKH